MKAFFIGCNHIAYMEALKRLVEYDGWDILYYVGRKNRREDVATISKKSYFHVIEDAIRGIGLPEIVKHGEKPLDSTVLERMSSSESIALSMMNRLDTGYSFPYSDRLRLYYTLLRYWITVIDRLAPDVVVYSASPHMVFDFVIYSICKDKGIRVVMFDNITSLGLYFPISGIDSDYPMIRESYKRLLSRKSDSNVVSDETNKYLDDIRSGTFLPFYMKVHKNLYRFPINHSAVGLIKKYISIMISVKDVPRKFVRYCINTPKNYVKSPWMTIEESNISGMYYCYIKNRAKVAKLILKNSYNRRSVCPDYSIPFVYVPLHYQPEASTSPYGGVYVDQYLIIDMLARTLPKGWKVYVKEHPSQFRHGPLFATNGRTKQFYRDIAHFDNVSLIDISADKDELIEKSRAVATVRGTAAWEGIVKGIPAMIYGDSWMEGCEGVFRIHTVEDCKEVVSKIENKLSVDYGLVKLFAEALFQSGYKACLYTKASYVDALGVSPEENIDAVYYGIKEVCDFYDSCGCQHG